MELNLIEKKSFSVIGKMGQGVAGNSSEWIQDLWDEANKNFHKITNLAKINNNGDFVGFWGIMSDVDENFLPWGWQGKYLAGCEVKDNVIAPVGWTKWTVPGFKYISVKCTHDNYFDVINYINNDYIKNNKYHLVGAIQEYYNPKDIDGSFYLYFPIEVL